MISEYNKERNCYPRQSEPGFSESHQKGYAQGLEDAARACERLSWAKSIDWWQAATKKDVSAESGRQCAAAIRALQKSSE